MVYFFICRLNLCWTMLNWKCVELLKATTIRDFIKQQLCFACSEKSWPRCHLFLFINKKTKTDDSCPFYVCFMHMCSRGLQYALMQVSGSANVSGIYQLLPGKTHICWMYDALQNVQILSGYKYMWLQMLHNCKGQKQQKDARKVELQTTKIKKLYQLFAAVKLL